MMSSSRTPLSYAAVMKPTRSACALSRANPSTVSPGHLHAMRQDAAHGIGMQRGVADAVAGADFSKQRPGFASGHRLPGLERPHRAGLNMPSARQADLRPLPCLVGLAAADAQAQPAGDDGDVFDLQRHQFGAAQRADEAEQQQRAITPAAGALITGGQQLAQHRQGQRGGLLHRTGMRPQHALQRTLDVAMAPGSTPGR